jgi:hypothetical protein
MVAYISNGEKDTVIVMITIISFKFRINYQKVG